MLLAAESTGAIWLCLYRLLRRCVPRAEYVVLRRISTSSMKADPANRSPRFPQGVVSGDEALALDYHAVLSSVVLGWYKLARLPACWLHNFPFYSPQWITRLARTRSPRPALTSVHWWAEHGALLPRDLCALGSSNDRGPVRPLVRALRCFSLIFTWTPTTFLALALVLPQSGLCPSSIPMMPVCAGEPLLPRANRSWI